jgi:hypothetical protein
VLESLLLMLLGLPVAILWLVVTVRSERELDERDRRIKAIMDASDERERRWTADQAKAPRHHWCGRRKKTAADDTGGSLART